MRDGQWKILKPHLIHTPQYVIFLIHCDSQWLSWLTLPQYGDIIWLSFHMASYQVFVSVISIKHVAFLFPLLNVLLDERQIVFNSAFTEFMIYCQYDLTDYRCLAEEHTHTHTHTHIPDPNQCETFILCFSKAFSTGTNYNPPQLYGPAERRTSERGSVLERERPCLTDFHSGRLHAHSPHSWADHSLSVTLKVFHLLLWKKKHRAGSWPVYALPRARS